MGPKKKKAREIEGIYRGNPKGFGFVQPILRSGEKARGSRSRASRAEDLFVPRGAEGDAIDGDRVLVRPGERGTARVAEVLERGRRKLAGSIAEGGQFKPDAHSIPRRITLLQPPGGPRLPAPRPGDKVIAFCEEGGLGFVLGEVLGRSGDPAVEDRAVLEEMEIPGEFPREVLGEGRAFEGKKVGLRDRRGRIDLRSEPTVVTIDPVTAKDFDDAISLRRTPGGGFVLGVHIADVGHYVRAGSALDGEARRRGSSAYLPARVVPMLPPALSDGLCSLREGEDRLAISVLLDYDRGLRLRGARAARTVIRSMRRLTYEHASRVMEGMPGETGEISRLLRDMHELARALRARSTALPIHEPGVEFVYSPAGDIVDIRTTEGDDAHWVIEEFMLAANREVAGWLLRLREPIPFRHHQPPGDLGELREFMAGLGIPGAREKALPELMRRAGEAGVGAAATSFLLEAMEAAEYNPREPRHDALGFPHYTHFTSPIRRYADLLVHRAAAKHLRPGRWVDMGPRERREAAGSEASPASTPELEDLSRHLSRRERAIALAERRLRRRRILEFLGKRASEPQAGMILRVLEGGLLVNLPGYLISGFIALGSLGPGASRVEPHKLRAGGRAFRTGEEIAVRVLRVDPSRGDLDLVLA